MWWLVLAAVFRLALWLLVRLRPLPGAGQGAVLEVGRPQTATTASASPALPVLALLQQHPCILQRGFFGQEEVSDLTNAVSSAPFAWRRQRHTSLLGTFDFVHFPVARTPSSLRPHIRKLVLAVPEVKFTEAWVQRYEVGQYVSDHQDPATYKACVAIAVFGDFGGAVSTVEGTQKEGRAGDVFFLRAKLGHLHMPHHQVSPVAWGTRYIILLTCAEGGRQMYGNAASKSY